MKYPLIILLIYTVCAVLTIVGAKITYSDYKDLFKTTTQKTLYIISICIAILIEIIFFAKLIYDYYEAIK